jgi:hypothetical protein
MSVSLGVNLRDSCRPVRTWTRKLLVLRVWKPLPENDWRRYSRLRKRSMWCSELLSVELAIALQLLVVTICKCSVNRITNLNSSIFMDIRGNTIHPSRIPVIRVLFPSDYATKMMYTFLVSPLSVYIPSPTLTSYLDHPVLETRLSRTFFKHMQSPSWPWWWQM